MKYFLIIVILLAALALGVFYLYPDLIKNIQNPNENANSSDKDVGYPPDATSAVSAVKGEISKIEKIHNNDVKITGISAKDWPDSCLGLAATNEFCAEVITPGYEIKARAKDTDYLYRTDKEGKEARGSKMFKSAKLKISFLYPTGYFATERDLSTGQRYRYEVVLMEDTKENRNLVEGKAPGREAPPTINIGIYQNNLDGMTAENWIRGMGFSNFKLSDGVLKEKIVGGEKGLAYHATGLYENENVVLAKPDFIYMFTVFYFSPSDEIRFNYENILETVVF
ncbi:hypothetical protein HYS99_01770 [Candidatus Giovannonibacteria bacterium]|nr:hypothetical protein [Candidatus Giovannonibacteria bacterium]